MAAIEEARHHTLPALGYSYDALEPAISAKLMELHHSKHHQAYVSGLNAAETALAKYISAGDIQAQIALQGALKFHGGGHTNHSLFWRNLQPQKEGGGKLERGPLSSAIDAQYGALDTLKEKINATAFGIQGSGWVWLGYDAADDRLTISTTKDQDPLIGQAVLLGIDMWEHAYYLDRLNDKKAYLTAIWTVIGWEEVSRRYEAATRTGKAKS